MITDRTLEQLLELLLRVSNERNKLEEQVRELNTQLWQYAAFPENFGLQRIPTDSTPPKGEKS